MFCDALLQAEGKKIKEVQLKITVEQGKMNPRPEVNNKPRRMFLPINTVNSLVESCFVSRIISVGRRWGVGGVVLLRWGLTLPLCILTT